MLSALLKAEESETQINEVPGLKCQLKWDLNSHDFELLTRKARSFPP